MKQSQQAVVHDVENFIYTKKKGKEKIHFFAEFKFLARPHPVTAYRLNYFFHAISKKIKKFFRNNKFKALYSIIE